MQQHAVPQQIASYEFRLVGDMTLKQFGWLAGGAITGLAIYSLPIVPMIKWGLILTVGFMGFAFAFLPIEERPLSTWVVAFFQAIFSPTLFIWKKRGVIPDFFNYRPGTGRSLTASPPPVDATQLNEYLKTLAKKDEPPSKPVPPPQEQPKEIKKVSPKISPKPSPQTELPPVARPNKPNLLAGIVLGPNEEMVEGAILEIKNTQGISVRAFKTNKLGQFAIATPLENGHYQIEIEKEGLNFDIIKIEAKGEVFPPLKIKAKES
ncbi:MAG: hypothetical protein ABH807_00015 [Candidatus Shapirobacteria bacterium]